MEKRRRWGREGSFRKGTPSPSLSFHRHVKYGLIYEYIFPFGGEREEEGRTGK